MFVLLCASINSSSLSCVFPSLLAIRVQHPMLPPAPDTTIPVVVVPQAPMRPVVLKLHAVGGRGLAHQAAIPTMPSVRIWEVSNL